MGSFLTINGYAVAIIDGSAGEGVEVIGDEGRAFSGELLPSRRAFKESWEGTSQPMTWTASEALKRLVRGAGHHWSFDDSADWHFSSKGLNVDSETGATHRTAAPAPKFGAGYIRLGATVQLEWQGGTVFTDEWTIMVWRHTGAVWEHWAIDDAGNKWADGVTTGVACPWITIDAAGGIILGDPASGAPFDFDDLVAVPYRLPSAMVAVFGTATRAFSELPYLELSGEITGDKVVEVAGAATTTLLQYSDGSAWVQNGRQVKILLEEA